MKIQIDTVKTSTTIEIDTAHRCAWRAVYLSLNGNQVAHLGVDPYNGVTPKLFGGISFLDIYKTFRLPLPAVRWRNDPSPLYLRAYKLSQAFWFRVDGRF